MNQTPTTDAATILRDALTKIRDDNLCNKQAVAKDALAAAERAAIQPAGEALTDEAAAEIAEIVMPKNDFQLYLNGDIFPMSPDNFRLALDLARDVTHIPQEAKAEQVTEADALADNDKVPYLIVFNDRDRKSEMVIGGTRARYRFKQISASWNAHLFVKVESNSRDDPRPSATPAAPEGDSEAGELPPPSCSDDDWEKDAADAGLIVNGLAVSGARLNAFFNGHRAGYARAKSASAAPSSVTSAPTAPAIGSIGDNAPAIKATTEKLASLSNDFSFDEAHASMGSIAPRYPHGTLAPEADEFVRLMTAWRFAKLGENAQQSFDAVVRYIDARSPVAAAPEGFVLVPVEPTEDMIYAGSNPISAAFKYKAMLAAAPTASTPPAPVSAPVGDALTDWPALIKGALKLAELGMGSYRPKYDPAVLADALNIILAKRAERSGV